MGQEEEFLNRPSLRELKKKASDQSIHGAVCFNCSTKIDKMAREVNGRVLCGKCADISDPPTTFKIVAAVDNGGLEPDFVLVEKNFNTEEEASTWMHIEDTQMENENVINWFVIEVF